MASSPITAKYLVDILTVPFLMHYIRLTITLYSEQPSLCNSHFLVFYEKHRLLNHDKISLLTF